MRNTIYNLRSKINKDEVDKIQQAKLEQELDGNLIQYRKVNSDENSKNF